MKEWIEVGSLTLLEKRSALKIEISGFAVAVFRSESDRLYALDDRCPHLGGPLSDGVVVGEGVTCPLHDRTFDLSTGKASYPDKECVHRYPISVKGGKIFVELPV